MFARFKKNQPVHITGALRHSTRWMTAAISDTFYANPNFDKTTTHDTVIYCIHGTADRSSAFSLVSNRLKNHLPPCVSGINLAVFAGRGSGKSIEYFAGQLEAKIKKNGHDKKKIIFFCHSRGGLVGAYFAEYLAKTAKIDVELVVTIGTPFKGSYLANSLLGFFSSSVKQMQKDSDFLKQLDERIQQSKTPYIHIAAELDHIVELESTYIDRKNLEVFSRHGHLSILSSQRLVTFLAFKLAKLYHSIEPKQLEDKEEAIAENAVENALKDACYSLYMQMDDVTNSYHIRSSTPKFEVLQNLSLKLQDMAANGRGSEYPEAKSIGDYIELYLEDTNAEGEKNIDIMKAQLNAPFSFLKGESHSETFLKLLIEKFKSFPLPLPAVTQTIEASSKPPTPNQGL